MSALSVNPVPQVVLLPGGVMPAEPAYRALLSELGDEVDAITKDLEVYAGDSPPVDFSLDTEVEGIRRAADDAGFERFHLVGYSGGGASSLAFVNRYPERLLSLALFEPAWAGNEGLGPEETALRERYRALQGLSPDEFMRGFIGYQLRPGVEPPPPPPPGPPPPWMATRPAGLAAFMHAFDAAALDLERLRKFDRPVYFGLGGRSNPDYYEQMARRLAGAFPDFTLEIYAERHHFDPPHRMEPARVADALRTLWSRAAHGSTAHPNESLVRGLYAAFNRRDLDAAIALFTEDAVFHCPGRNRIAGDHRGRGEVLAFWQAQIDLSQGTFRPVVTDVLVSDRQVAVIVDVGMARADRRFAWLRAIVYRVRGGRFAEAWVYEGDQAAADEFFA